MFLEDIYPYLPHEFVQFENKSLKYVLDEMKKMNNEFYYKIIVSEKLKPLIYDPKRIRIFMKPSICFFRRNTVQSVFRG